MRFKPTKGPPKLEFSPDNGKTWRRVEFAEGDEPPHSTADGDSWHEGVDIPEHEARAINRRAAMGWKATALIAACAVALALVLILIGPFFASIAGNGR